jgi:uncharacterized membrane protein
MNTLQIIVALALIVLAVAEAAKKVKQWQRDDDQTCETATDLELVHAKYNRHPMSEEERQFWTAARWD